MKINVAYVNIEGGDKEVVETTKSLSDLVVGVSKIFSFFESFKPSDKKESDEADYDEFFSPVKSNQKQKKASSKKEAKK